MTVPPDPNVTEPIACPSVVRVTVPVGSPLLPVTLMVIVALLPRLIVVGVMVNEVELACRIARLVVPEEAKSLPSPA